jgi:hypothetical protein
LFLLLLVLLVLLLLVLLLLLLLLLVLVLSLGISACFANGSKPPPRARSAIRERTRRCLPPSAGADQAATGRRTPRPLWDVQGVRDPSSARSAERTRAPRPAAEIPMPTYLPPYLPTYLPTQ